jgi:hypothetical protein
MCVTWHQIWSSVEANDYLKATLLYTRAEQAHSRLVHNPAFAQLLVTPSRPHTNALSLESQL